MKPRHVIVNGDELDTELARLKASGSLVESVDVLAGKRSSAYRINFVERAEELAPPVAVRKVAAGTYFQQVNNPAALNPFPHPSSSSHRKPTLGRGAETVAVDPSISDRMTRLKSLAIGAGRVRQFKPSTNPNSARTKHNND